MPYVGINTVYVWFKDSLGNANSVPFSDSIDFISIYIPPRPDVGGG
jgi:hypothetical protein